MPSKLHLLLLATLVILAAVRGQAVEESLLIKDEDRRNLRPLRHFRPNGGPFGGVTVGAKDGCEDKECPSHKPICCIFCCVRGSKIPYCTDRDCDSDDSFTDSIEAAEIEGFP